MGGTADVRAEKISLTGGPAVLPPGHPGGEAEVALRVHGEHQVGNALPPRRGLACGMDVEQIAAARGGGGGSRSRMDVRVTADGVTINDPTTPT